MLYFIYFSIATFSSLTTFIIYNYLVQGRDNIALKEIAKLESLVAFFQNQAKNLETQISLQNEEIKAINEEKYQALRECEVAKSKLQEFDKRLTDFEQSKKEALDNSKAAIFEIANQLSSKLISDHRRENEEVRKNSLEKFNEVTQKYQTQFDDVLKSVAALNSQV